MRPALTFVLLVAFAAVASAQLPAGDGVYYSRDERIKIPFVLKTGGPATKVTLFSSYDGGAWQEYESARPGQKKEFLFKADRDGPYSFATMTHFSDGPSDPPRRDQLTEQRRVIIDRTPPKIQSVRAVTSADGAPGIEWDVTDDYMDPKGIRLEFRWDGQGRYEPIDKNVPFGARDTRYWQLKPADRMQVRLIATDRAGNHSESNPVWVSGKDGERGGEPTPRSTPAAGTSGMRDSAVNPAAGSRAIQPTLHYLSTQSVALKLNAEVGPSGLTKATLYWADEKLEWKPHNDVKGPQAAPETNSPDKQRFIPVDFNFQAPKDGLYYFIVVVENHRASSRKVPIKGDPGDIQVMVDTTKPEVKFSTTPRVTSNGDRAAVVDIRWEAKDANIAPVPIKLEYSAVRRDKPGEPGEWKAITDWMDNTGQYSWSAPSAEAHLFLIRVTCKDRAGNEAKFETVTPVNVDLEVPKVQGVDVAPGGKIGLGPAPGAPGIPDITVAPGSPPKK